MRSFIRFFVDGIWFCVLILFVGFAVVQFSGCGDITLGDSANESPNNNDVINSDDHSNNNSDSDDSNKNPQCADRMGVDGTGTGFLWKAESEKDGKLVAIFPKEFINKFVAVFAVRNNGDQEAGVFTGFANGGRQHWRFKLPGSEYTGLLLVDDLTQSCEWEVENPSERQD